MGCDIHSTVQVKRDGQWVTVEEKIFPFVVELGPVEEELLKICPALGDTHTAEPFKWRDYGMFGFLADVRNYSHVPPISEQRGLTEDIARDRHGNRRDDYGKHSFSWLGLDELLAFDYDAYFEDRRCTKELGSGPFAGFVSAAADAGVGNGKSKTVRKLLGEHFFRDLEIMKRLDPDPANVRVVFSFDS